MSDIYPYYFETQIEKFGVGKSRKVWYNVLMLPEELKAELPFESHPRLRVDGEIANVPVSNAFIPSGDGRYYIIVAPNVLKDGGVRLGDWVEMRFTIADQAHVNVPRELEDAIENNKSALASWVLLTPGKKRALANHVASAKTVTTTAKRVNEAIEALISFKADLRAWRKATR